MESRTQSPRPPSEWVEVPVPAIVSQDTFNTVQRRLECRRPNRTTPRVVNGPTLHTGLARCDCCATGENKRAGMMLRTGKSGRYRYLVCANRATNATFACNAPQIRMEVIDELVLSEVETHVLAPQRMRHLLQAMVDRQDSNRAGIEAELHRQKEALRKAESGVRSLFAAVADAPDLVRLDDPIYREQIALLSRQRADLSASIPVLEERLRAGPVAVSDERIAIFSKSVRNRLRSADPSFRRQWLHLFVDEVVIGRSEMMISCRADTQLNGVTGRSDFFGTMVPSFDQEWRARRDSNS